MPTRFVEHAHFDSPASRQLTESYVRTSTLTPDAVADAALRAAARRQLYVVTGSNQRWYWRAKRWLPMTLLHRVARRVRKDLANITKQPRTTDN
jgi:hypothetical protein